MLPTPRCDDTAIRILIADDHAVVRDGLKRLLGEENDFCVIGEAKDGEDALHLARQLHPDVLLLDLLMPRADGLQVLRELCEQNSAVRVIMLTAAMDKQQIRQALEYGARGVIMKTSAVETLVRSIRAVMTGEYWVDRATLADLLQTQKQANSSRFGLTPRELEMVAEIAKGAANKDIANKFAISDKTVKRHLVNIFDKVGVSSRLELAVFAMNHGLSSKD